VCMCMCVGVGVGVCVPEYNLVNVTSAVYMHVCVYKYIHKYLHTFIQSVSISLPLHIKSYWIPGVLKNLTSVSVMLLDYSITLNFDKTHSLFFRPFRNVTALLNYSVFRQDVLPRMLTIS
jgi:hypothetical protein